MTNTIRTACTRSFLPFAILLVGLSAWAPAEGVPPDDSQWFNKSERNEHAAIGFLWPVLKSAGNVGRIYFSAYCPSGVNDPVVFPKIDVDPPVNSTFGATDVDRILRNTKDISVLKDANGIARVTIGKISGSVLKTRLSKVVLDPASQYNALLAVNAIAWSKEVKIATGRLRIRLVNRPAIYGVIQPARNLPHLPSMISNLTLDQALDVVANTFHSTILYGECANSNLFEIYVRSGLHFDGSAH